MSEPNATTLGIVLERLDRQDRVLDRIESKVDKTNGRVTALEKREAVTEGVRQDRARRLLEATKESEGQRDRTVVLQAAALSATVSVAVFVIALILALVFHLHT